MLPSVETDEEWDAVVPDEKLCNPECGTCAPASVCPDRTLPSLAEAWFGTA